MLCLTPRLMLACLLALTFVEKAAVAVSSNVALLVRFDSNKVDHRPFTIGSQKYDLGSLSLSNPSDPRFGLSFVWITVPVASYKLSVDAVRKAGRVSLTFEATASPKNDVLLINGGYFGRKDGLHSTPMGLVIADGVRISKFWPWISGGVLVATHANSPVQIIPIRSYQISNAAFSAVQSKPLLVEDMRSGIRSDDHQFANRTAIALCTDGSLLFVGAFADGGAVSLYELAALITSGKLSKSPVKIALNMDGGPGAHIFVPRLGLHFGSDAVTYVPDIARVSSNLK